MNIPVVFSTDHNYIMPTGVAISSLIRNSKSSYKIFILTANDVTEEDKIKLHDCINNTGSSIEFINMGEEYSNAFVIRGITISAYYRLSLPQILKNEDKIIYIDVDVIIQQDLKSLYEFDLGNNYLGAVKAYINPEYAKSIDCDPLFYFNSGVLLMNLKAFRENNLAKEINSLINNKFTYQDQDILNLICKNKVLFLPIEYNVTHSNFELAIKRSNDIFKIYSKEELLKTSKPVILHYSGDKPWKGPVIRGGIWWEEYKESSFYDFDFYMNGLYRNSYKIKSLRSLLKSLYLTIFHKF